MTTSDRYRPAHVPYTYREYCLLPDDGRRYEIIDGDLYVSPAPTPFHQTVSRRLQFELMKQLEQHGLAYIFNAPIDVILSNETIVQPDLALLSTGRRELITKRGIEGPPDVVVEILSPSTKGNDRHLKRSAYARFGIPEYWIVDPDGGFVEVFRRTDDGYDLEMRHDRASTLRSLVFDAVEIPLAPVFAPH